MDFKGVVLPIITMAIGIIASMAVLKSRKPLYWWRVSPVFQEGVLKIQGIKITYKDTEVRNLSSIFLAFWNDGKDTITSDMIAEQICFKSKSQQKFFDARVIKATTRDSNKLNVYVSDDLGSVNLDFEYLDQNQGAVIQIFSSGNDFYDYAIEGKIIGLKPFDDKRANDARKAAFLSLAPKGKLYMAAEISLFFALAAFAISQYLDPELLPLDYLPQFLKPIQSAFETPRFLNYPELDRLFSYMIILLLLASLILIIISGISHALDPRYHMPKEFKEYF